MEFTKENMRFYIFMYCKLGEYAKLIHKTLQTICADCADSYQTVCRRVKEFNEGKESLSDCHRRGRPKPCLNEQTIASIMKDIDEDPHVSERALSDTTGLSYDTVYTIITEHFRMKKLAGRKFDRIQDLAKALNSELRTISEEDYQRVFRKWQIRLKRCIKSHGEYFEGL
ncbi:transposase [Elysia marginata]|uniref:Transposase n=1 Tax=Elysia marginata TaxID=1093978 RepID=A0AAV4ERU8_9GAST|nr:transposase [Elysia marginata]